jgi:hypothetical protein
MAKEVGRLREERQKLEHDLADMFALKAKYTAKIDRVSRFFCCVMRSVPRTLILCMSREEMSEKIEIERRVPRERRCLVRIRTLIISRLDMHRRKTCSCVFVGLCINRSFR